MLRKTLPILLILVSTLRAGAEDWQITRLDMQAGLSDNCVNDVLMDSRHFLWIGTNAGLDLYDGCNIAQVAFPGADYATPPVVFILVEDRSGIIWAGTSEGCTGWMGSAWKCAVLTARNWARLPSGRCVTVKQASFG